MEPIQHQETKNNPFQILFELAVAYVLADQGLTKEDLPAILADEEKTHEFVAAVWDYLESQNYAPEGLETFEEILDLMGRMGII